MKQNSVALISTDTENVLPEANNIIAKARQDASIAATELAASRTRTRQFILWVDLAVILIVLGCSWRIGRSITYRAGAFQVLAQMALLGELPHLWDKARG